MDGNSHERLQSLSAQILRLIQMGAGLVAIAHMRYSANGVPVVDFVEYLKTASTHFDMLDFVDSLEGVIDSNTLEGLILYWSDYFLGNTWT